MMISNWKLYNLGTLWTRDSDQKISWFWSEFESSIYIIWYFSTAVNAQTLRSQVPQFEIGSISRWWNTYFECLIYPCLFDIRVQIWRFPFGDVQQLDLNIFGVIIVMEKSILWTEASAWWVSHQPIPWGIGPRFFEVSIWAIRHWSTSEPRWAVCACGSWNSHIPRAPRSLGWTFRLGNHRITELGSVSLRKNMWKSATWGNIMKHLWLSYVKAKHVEESNNQTFDELQAWKPFAINV